MSTWTELSKPVSPAQNTLIARAMSALTKDGRRPTFSEAEAYAREQAAQQPINHYADRRG